MPRIILFLFHLLLATAAGAQTTRTLLRYDFQAEIGGNLLFENAPELIEPGLSAGGWLLRDGSLDFSAGPGGSATDLAMLARSWGAGGTPGNRFSLELTIAPGRSLQLEGYSFSEQASGSGPSGWSLEIDGTPLASGPTATSFTTRAGALSLAPLQGTVLVTLAAQGASSDSGSWRIDEFTLDGNLSTVPLPASLTLLACALPLLGRRRQR
ncbi:MAG: hypothetical protein D6786_10640 [Gammaproteobacteria bacterium]|nr:MAG: hypothetical protein D6786_10640 [Gammaproteobacteria bacterium]